MKTYLNLFMSLVFLITAGCAYGSNASPSAAASTHIAQPAVVPVSATVQTTPKPAVAAAKPTEEEYVEDEFDEYSANAVREEKVKIADPLEPFNRAMHEFNDKMYFWAVKPVAQGYQKIVPETARISVRNFFSNLGFPARFLNCLLQADFKGAATETGRFTINTIWGIGGLLDPSSGKELNLQEQDTDFGQTLGVWGIGQGFYIVWPVFGPSTPRDTVSMAGDYFLDPVAYVNPWSVRLGVNVFDKVNSASLRIGDYEALKGAAIDPYLAFRDAYAQYRYERVKARKAKWSSPAPAAGQSPEGGAALPEKVK